MFFHLLIISAVLLMWLLKLNETYHVLAFFAKRIQAIDGSPLENVAPTAKGRTIFGNTFDIIGLNTVGLWDKSRMLAKKLKKSYVEYGLGSTLYNVITPEDAEAIFTNPNLITKGFVYNFLEPFLRTGLLTSTEKKWHSRRKLLTPAFHFNILRQFEDVFKQESKKFVDDLKKQDGCVVSLSKLIPKFTLNSVCETALGVKLDERLDGDDYRKSFKMIEECFMKRVSNPFYINDNIFNFFEGHKYEKHLKAVHEFSSGIIEKRRKLFEKVAKGTIMDKNHEEEFSKKKRYAMLDTLLLAEKDGLIDHIGICEEVDTFMFEGFDTTSMGLTFCLMNIALYPDLQERCYKEIIENIDENVATLDITQLSKLKYLEYFLKESLRLYPSVPVIMRKALHDTKLDNKLCLPASTQIVVHIFDIHRDPRHWPKPDFFDPERFSPENSSGRHPYAYVPFSAGQRNCIGQKFAMLEMKTLLVYVIKNFKLLPISDPKEFSFEAGIIIRSFIDIKVKIVKRQK